MTPKKKSPSDDKEVIEIDWSSNEERDANKLELESSLKQTNKASVPSKNDSKKDKKKKPFFNAANEEFQKQMRRNINPVSFIGKKEETALENTVSPKLEGEQVPLEKDMDKTLYCTACKQLHEYCHRRKYSDYIKKKIFFEYKNKTTNPEPDEIQAVIKEGYNEKRKVEVHSEFKFYDGAVYPLPNCLYGFSWELVHMVNELTGCTRINCNTKNGIVEFI